ncbi:MAG TPA: hypothetical protein PKD37_00430 [Oligoflexia bacterium]|nr:hypothetical protein [Oligoflexia bacterium]HMP26446.1 hypothetical protein [Oligoflexia bacterium]
MAQNNPNAVSQSAPPIIEGKTLVPQKGLLFAKINKIFAITLILLGVISTYPLVSARRTLDKERAIEWSKSIPAGWSAEMRFVIKRGDDFLKRYGFPFERKIFEWFSGQILNFAYQQNATAVGLNSIDRGLLWLLIAEMRIFPILLIALRFILIILLTSWFAGFYRLKTYQGSDPLGLLSNGRLFFSGLTGGINAKGEALIEVSALVSLQTSSKAEYERSAISRILKATNAENQSNITIARNILAYKNYPAYIAPEIERSLLEEFIEPHNLETNSEIILTAGLTAWRKILDRQVPLSQTDLPIQAGQAERTTSIVSANLLEERMSCSKFAQILEDALCNSLTRKLREAMQEISAQEIATLLLAHAGGKILSFNKIGANWSKSSFPELSARALLNSVQSLQTDYDSETRNRLRRALIYSSRHSIFAPNKLPRVIDEKTLALRQWGEIILAQPYNLRKTLNEAELFAYSREAEHVWFETFATGIIGNNQQIFASSYATNNGLLLLPLEIVAALARKAMTQRQFTNIQRLVNEVYKEHRLLSMQLADPSESPLASEKRIFRPFDEEEINNLQSTHKLSKELIEFWSAFRVVLNSRGWLASRVGESASSESGLHKIEIKLAGTGNKVSAAGMVALRTAYLDEKFGTNWLTKFMLIDSITQIEQNKQANNSQISHPEINNIKSPIALKIVKKGDSNDGP